MLEHHDFFISSDGKRKVKQSWVWRSFVCLLSCCVLGVRLLILINRSGTLHQLVMSTHTCSLEVSVVPIFFRLVCRMPKNCSRDPRGVNRYNFISHTIFWSRTWRVIVSAISDHDWKESWENKLSDVRFECQKMGSKQNTTKTNQKK